MSDYQYVVTAHKPTAVTDSLTGNFTSPTDRNLVVNKCTRVEIYLLSPEGVKPMFDFQLYGRIASMKLFRRQGENQDWIFILTERYQICVLAYDPERKEIVTKANGDVKDRIGRPTDYGMMGLIDPDARVLGLHLYFGLFKVISVDAQGQFKEAFNLRLEQLKVHDIVFLYKCPSPTIAVLFEDTKAQRHLHTYSIAQKEKEFVNGPWKRDHLEPGANSLVPVPTGGVILLGESSISYLADGQAVTISTDQSTMKAHGMIDADGSRFLLGDYSGRLYVLILVRNGDTVSELKCEPLGTTSCPNSISYLDNGYVYIGSGAGDSQIIKLRETPGEDGQLFEVVETFPNLGPILDFDVVNLEQGQGRVVTCSGSGHDGSIRVIRNGIGINEQASVELPGIKGMWALAPAADGGDAQTYHRYLVQAFYGETRILALENGELEETEFDGFAAEEQSLYCSLVAGGHFVQVTEKSVRLVDADSKALVSEWTPAGGSAITVAAGNHKQIVVSLSGKIVVLLSVEMAELKETARRTMDHEVSCLSINPVLTDGDEAQFCAVGLWKDMSVRILSVPSLEELNKAELGGEVIARSVLFTSFEGIAYLLVALGDGHLFTFVLATTDGGKLSDRRKLALGTQPIDLTTFVSKGTTYVFAASDRPTVVYSSNRKLLYSNVNLKEVSCVSPFITQEFGDSLAIAGENLLTIGTIDDIQKLHVRSIPLHETPRSIAYMESKNVFAVSTLKVDVNEHGEEVEESFLKLIDETTNEIKATYAGDPSEQFNIVICTKFANDDNEYFVVGTALVYAQDAEPEKGRILVLQVVDGQFKLIAETAARGCVWQVQPFNGRLVAGINSKVMLYDIKTDNGKMSIENLCGHHGHIVTLYIATIGEFIVIGDMVQSICVIHATEGADGKMTMKEIAADPNSNWMTAIQVLDNDTYLGAENSFNLFTVKKNSAAATDEERSRLETIGEYHLGEFVNRFRAGSLVMAQTDSEDAIVPTHLFGTINGALGVIAQLTKKQYDFLLKVQTELNKVVKGVGGFSHTEWRSFCNDRKSKEPYGYIDGDLVEVYLDLSREKQAKVAAGVGVSVDELSKRIEDLSRIH